MRIIRLLVAATLAAALPALPGPVAAQRAARGLIAYSRDGIVYVAAPDGSGETPYVAGEWPSLAGDYSSHWIVWVARRGDARVLMKGDLTKTDRPLELVPLPGEGRVHVDWWSDGALVVGVDRGGTYEVAVVERPGPWQPLPVPRVSSPHAVWHDNQRVVVPTEDGPVLYDPRDGAVEPVAGARPGDVPVGDTAATALLVNGRDGVARVDRTAGTRQLLLGGGYGWDGSLYTHGRDIGYLFAQTVSEDPATKLKVTPRPLARLPDGARVLAAQARTDPAYHPLVELAAADGGVAIYAAAEPPHLKEHEQPTPRAGEPLPPVRKVADGAGLTKTNFLDVAGVRPPFGRPEATAAATGPPPVPEWAPRTSEPATRGWLPVAAGVAVLAAVLAGGVVATRRRARPAA